MERPSVRATLDCGVVISEITMAAIGERSREWMERVEALPGIPEPPPEQMVHDSALVLEELLKDPASLDAWLVYDVATVLYVEGIPEAVLPRGEDKRILAPVIERLPPAERHRLREAIASGRLYEHLEDLYFCVDVDIQGIELQHVDGPGTSPRTGWRRFRPTLVEPSGRDGTVERRRVRALVDYEIEIRDITMAAVEARYEAWLQARIEEGWHPTVFGRMPSKREVEDARLLQEALRADPASLDAWLLHKVAMQFAVEGIEVAEPPDGEEERILGPVVERLPPAPWQRFHDALAEDRFHEVGGELYRSFDASIQRVEYEHVDVDGDLR